LYDTRVAIDQTKDRELEHYKNALRAAESIIESQRNIIDWKSV